VTARLPTPEEMAAALYPPGSGVAVKSVVAAFAIGKRDVAILARLGAAVAAVDPCGDAGAELNALGARIAAICADLRGAS
jgi:hypothetical protein